MRTVSTPSGLVVYDYPPDPASANGSDPPLVVAVHGSMDRGTSFARVRLALADLHFVTYDRRGYHRSRQAAFLGQDFDGHVLDLFEVLETVGAAEGSLVLLGHSFGGDIVLAAAEQKPASFTGIVAFEPPLTWRPWWPSAQPGSWMDSPDPGDAAEAFIRRMIGDERFERLPLRTREDRRKEAPALLAELRSLRSKGLPGTEPPFRPDRISVPVVIGRGSRTNAHQLRGTSELAGEIPGAVLWEIPGAAHGAHLTHPRELAAMVRRVLR
jgi:pimeloyl-ACP methyl ester carboxylesterase